MFGEGDIRGVAAPESANNAGAQTSFIPMLTLGIPSNPTMALMIGALTIQGIAPGPQVMTERPELFWGLIASMWVGNLMLLILNLPMVGLWIRLLAVPYRLLFPAIFVFCCIGVYTVDGKIFDVYAIVVLSALAYVLLKLDCEPARPDDRVRRRDGVRDAANLGGLPDCVGGAAGGDRAPNATRQARGGNAGVVATGSVSSRERRCEAVTLRCRPRDGGNPYAAVRRCGRASDNRNLGGYGSPPSRGRQK
jgi:hypothetical protein